MATALSRGHHVVVPVARDVRPRGLVVDVPALDRQKAAEALVQETGLDWGIADRYAAHARRNLLSLRRTLAHISAVTRPAWSQGAEGRRLAPLILAGSWTEDSEGDRSAIELLTGRTYADIEGDLALWGRAGGRPFAAQAGHGASCPRATRGTLAPRSSPGPTSGFVTMITAAMPGGVSAVRALAGRVPRVGRGGMREPTSVHLVLTGPGGGTWDIPIGHSPPASAPVGIVTDAVGFCWLVANRATPDRLGLHITGDPDRVVMVLAMASALALD